MYMENNKYDMVNHKTNVTSKRHTVVISTSFAKVRDYFKDTDIEYIANVLISFFISMLR